MRKCLSLLLTIVMLIWVIIIPVSAKADIAKTALSFSMTEEEFRVYTEKKNLLSDSFTRYAASNSEEDYYYANLIRLSDFTALEAYEVTQGSFEWGYSNSLEREAWISVEPIEVGAMHGVAIGSVNFEERFEKYLPKLIVGVWACRLDDPASFERYTNVSTIDINIEYDPKNYVISSFTVYVVLEDHPYYDPSHIELRDQKVAQIVHEANKKDNQYEALMYIHDYLALNGEYDNDSVSAEPDTDKFYYAHSSMGILNNNLGVCESYAKAFKIICDALGNPPDNAIITSATHMWNIVKLKGEWYCVDVTWDDEGGSIVSKEYFLCGDPDIIDGDSQEHIPDGTYCDAPNYAESAYEHRDEVPTLEAPTAWAEICLDYVRLCWSSVLGASSYEIYRREYVDSEWSEWSRISRYGKRNELCDIDVVSGVKYQYKVRAIKDYSYGYYSNDVEITYLGMAEITSTNEVLGIKSSWNKLGGADGYIVYRKEHVSYGWTQYKELGKCSEPFYVDTDTISSRDYQYAVRAYSSESKGDLSEGKVVRRLAVPEVTVSADANGIVVTFQPVAGANSYILYRKQLNGSGWSGWKTLATTSSYTYEDTKVKSGVTYKYTARAVCFDYQSSFKESATLKFLTTPKVKVSTDNKTITASWSKVEGVSGYTVYRREKVSGKWSGWTKLKNTAQLKYVDKVAVAGKEYQYTVRAYSGSDTSTFIASSVVIMLSVPKVTISNAAGGVKVDWKKVAGAKNYIIYRRTYSGGKWSGYTRLGTTTGISYTDKKAVSGAIYQYTVRAVYGSYISSYKASASLKYLATPKVTVAAGKSRVTVKWNKISGASGYTLYQRVYNGKTWSGWKAVKNTTARSYTDKSVSKKYKYQYTVRAYSGSYKSAFTASATVTCK